MQLTYRGIQEGFRPIIKSLKYMEDILETLLK